MIYTKIKIYVYLEEKIFTAIMLVPSSPVHGRDKIVSVLHPGEKVCGGQGLVADLHGNLLALLAVVTWVG